MFACFVAETRSRGNFVMGQKRKATALSSRRPDSPKTYI